MTQGRRVVEEYSQLIARAFNGAITVNGQRIVAHPSGTLIVRGSEPRPVPRPIGAPDREPRMDGPGFTPGPEPKMEGLGFTPGPEIDWSDV